MSVKSDALICDCPACVEEKTTSKRRAQSVRYVCNECKKKFSRSINNYDVECPKCGGVDVELQEL